MPNEALGIYLKLLCLDWINDGLPNEKNTIMRLGNFDWTDFQGQQRDADDFDLVFSHVMRKFIDHPKKQGFITNPRLLREREKQKKWRKKCRQGGKKSGEVRRKGSSTTLGSKRELKGNSSSSSSSSTTTREDKTFNRSTEDSTPKQNGAPVKLEEKNFRISLLLLSEKTGIKRDIAVGLAEDYPLGRILHCIAYGAGGKNPNGKIRNALEKGWDVPKISRKEAERMIHEAQESEKSKAASLWTQAKRQGPNQKQGESGDDFLRRLTKTQTEKLR